MSAPRVFNESVFDSYNNLQNFFRQSDSIQNVLSRKDKPYSKPLYQLNPDLPIQWKICQAVTAPFRMVSAFFLFLFAEGARTLGATALKKQIGLIKRHLWIGFNSYSTAPTKVYKIKGSVNSPNKNGEIVNATPFIPESQITDPKVKKKTFSTIHKGIQFGHKEGICRGMSQWFIYLYLNTKNAFTHPREHIAAIGKEFSKGGNEDATLLQSLYLKGGKLLNLRAGPMQPQAGNSNPLALYEREAHDWLSNSADAAHDLTNAPAGAYGVHFPLHATAWIKIDNQLSYFFDPNHGISEIQGPDQGKQAYALFSKSLKETGVTYDLDVLLAVGTPRVAIRPVKLR